MSKHKTINFRAHHLICNLCFCGKGYTEEFVDNFKLIQEKINAKKGGETAIKIVSGCDDICAKCPKKKGVVCDHERAVSGLDRACPKYSISYK